MFNDGSLDFVPSFRLDESKPWRRRITSEQARQRKKRKLDGQDKFNLD